MEESLEERMVRIETLLNIHPDSPLIGSWGLGQVSAGHIDIVQLRWITPGGKFSCMTYPGGTNCRTYARFWPLSDAEVKRLKDEGCPLEGR